MAMSFYDFSIKLIDSRVAEFEANSQEANDKVLKLAELKGKVVLIVNTASRCGFTPQYEGLEDLHKSYAALGLVIIGFPCNQFGQQEPGDEATIGHFCSTNYGVTFPLSEKVEVNGPNTAPLFKFLKDQKPGLLGSKAIKWNFTKFLIARDGSVLERYASATKPESLTADIEKALNA
jgi:glutathione peroxidase